MEPSRLVSRTIVLVALVVAVVATGFAISHRTSAPTVSFRIAKLRGAVVEMGELASWDYHDKAYGVRLHATVCVRPNARTVESYPVEFQITHFALSGSQPTSWGRPFRTVADDANWIVPFAEGATECRDVVVEDILPDEDYKGVESDLGLLSVPARFRPHTDPRQCYGVALRIKARFEFERPVVRYASGRAIVQCGPFGPT